MLTLTENELRSLHIADRLIQKRIGQIEKKLIFSYTMNISEKPSYKNLLESLQLIFRHNKLRWVNLEFIFRYKIKNKVIGYSILETKRFLFGQREFILANIKEITGRIVDGTTWGVEAASISKVRESDIIRFLN